MVSRYKINMKMKPVLLHGLLVCCVFAAPLMAQEAKEDAPAGTEKKYYKTYGPNGEVIYSDKPVKNAKEIKAPKASTYEPVATPAFEASKPAPKQKPFEYDSLVISKPAHEESIWSNEGKLDVSLSLEPTLRNGHSIAISVDGNRVKSGSELTYQLSGIDPGEHKLTVEIVDSVGKVIQSQDVTFYLRRHTIKR